MSLRTALALLTLIAIVGSFAMSWWSRTQRPDPCSVRGNLDDPACSDRWERGSGSSSSRTVRDDLVLAAAYRSTPDTVAGR